MSPVLLEYGKPVPPGVTEAEVLRVHPGNTEETTLRQQVADRPLDWFARLAWEHDRLATFIRESFPGEEDCGKPTRRETAFDDALRLLHNGLIMATERAAPRTATHLELTIKYTIPAEKANIGDITEGLRDGSKGDEGLGVPFPGGKVELVRVKAVPAPE